MTWQVIEADCVEAMREMDEASVDAVVCDPPYGIGFMNKGWDSPEGPEGWGYWAGSGKRPVKAEMHEFQAWSKAWATEALRVLKPGGHLLAFGGTRTYHRLACAVEDAGFEIRDSVIWLYGSGFPKSLDVGMAIDKGKRREFVAAAVRLGIDLPGRSVDDWTKEDHAPGDRWWEAFKAGLDTDDWQRIEREVVGVAHRKNDRDAVSLKLGRRADDYDLTAPATPEAQRWQGWGTAMKPAHEPIVVARKPLIGTVAQNVERFGTGAINVDATRIGTEPAFVDRPGRKSSGGILNITDEARLGSGGPGRWPANVALSHLPECQRVGERRVKNPGGVPDAASAKDSQPAFTSSERTSTVHHFADDGLETVEAWSCVEGCPVRELDRQSGEQRSGVAGKRTDGVGMFGIPGHEEWGGYGDKGGASRFFATFPAEVGGSGPLVEAPFAKPPGGGDATADLSGEPRFRYVAKASRAERDSGLGIDRCTCETSSGWVNEDQPVSTPPDSAQPLARDTTVPTSEDGSEWSTTGSGSSTTARSPKGDSSTTETDASRTTESRTSSLSTPSPTSDSTPLTTADGTDDGSAAAPSAESGRSQTPRTSTSRAKAGSATADADRATSGSSSNRNSEDARCASCGGVIGGALRNAHPT